MAYLLPIPVKPMLAKRATRIPASGDYIFEPKWDGFRVMLFKDGSDWHLQSRDLKPLNRYFPELEAPIATLPERCVLDGELLIETDGSLDFPALQQRIHPADSRVQMLAETTPAQIVFFDCLALGDEDLTSHGFGARRDALLSIPMSAPLSHTPATTDRALAAEWFVQFEGAGLDGVMAKDPASPYEAGKRSMIKVKHERTADCVVAGFRWHKSGDGVGSLMLGLFDSDGKLQSIGVASSFSAKRRAELTAELEPYRAGAEEGHPWKEWADWAQRVPDQGGNRWNRGATAGWEPLRIEVIAEVKYDSMQGNRLRHVAHFKRWRPDKPIADCNYDQLEVAPPFLLRDIFGAGDPT